MLISDLAEKCKDFIFDGEIPSGYKSVPWFCLGAQYYVNIEASNKEELFKYVYKKDKGTVLFIVMLSCGTLVWATGGWTTERYAKKGIFLGKAVVHAAVAKV